MRLLPSPFIRQARRVVWPLAVLVAAIQLSACGEAPAQEQSRPAMPAQPVDVLTLAPQSISLHTELAGRVSPLALAEIRPQVDGIVLERTFEEGGDIVKGEVLYRIDPSIYQADVMSAKASLAQAQANLEVNQLSANRIKNLLKSKSVSQQEFDEANARLKQSRAEVSLAEARLTRAKIDLSYTQIVSPITGRVGRSAVTQGALVTANQQNSMATVQQLDPVYVDLTQSSAELLKLRRQIAAGGRYSNPDDAIDVTLMLEDGSTYPLTGKLAFSEVSVNQQNGAVTLRAVFPNSEQILLPGMFVKATVATTQIDDALLVPPGAVGRTAKGEPSVMTVTPESTVALKILNNATLVNGQWLIEGGIVAGEKVIVGGGLKVFPGAPVQIASDSGNHTAAQHQLAAQDQQHR